MADRRPAMMVGGDELAESLARLAAAAGCAIDGLTDLGALRQRWPVAPLVLLDGAACGRCAEAGLARRDGVIVVAAGAPGPEVWQHAVAVGAEHVAILPDAETWLVGALADAVEAPAQRGRVLAVLGGRGGAGASVLAAATATRAADDGDVLLVDCDALGGGLDLVLGVEDSAGLRWPGLSLTAGRVAASSLHAALPTSAAGANGRLTVLSCDRGGHEPDAAAVRTVCAAGRRAGDTVVCDLPRHACQPATAALECADLAVLVVPAEVRACAAATGVAERVTRLGAALQLVVRGPAPGGLTPGDVARALGVPLLAGMRPQPGMAGALDRGQLPGRRRGPLATTAESVLAALDAQGGTIRERAA